MKTCKTCAYKKENQCVGSHYKNTTPVKDITICHVYKIPSEKEDDFYEGMYLDFSNKPVDYMDFYNPDGLRRCPTMDEQEDMMY